MSKRKLKDENKKIRISKNHSGALKLWTRAIHMLQTWIKGTCRSKWVTHKMQLLSYLPHLLTGNNVKQDRKTRVYQGSDHTQTSLKADG